MVRRARSQTLTLPRMSARAAIALVIMERLQRADEVAGDHQVVRLVDRDAVRIESVRGRRERPRLHEPRASRRTRPPARVVRRRCHP